jgi:hypothetical protein
VLDVRYLIHHGNPIARVQHAAKAAAAREAETQIRRLSRINLELETPHHRLVVRQWLRELRQVAVAARRREAS